MLWGLMTPFVISFEHLQKNNPIYICNQTSRKWISKGPILKFEGKRTAVIAHLKSKQLLLFVFCNEF